MFGPKIVPIQKKENGKWIPFLMADLKKGDHFRVLDESSKRNKPVEIIEGEGTELVAMSDAYYSSSEGQWKVDIDTKGV